MIMKSLLILLSLFVIYCAACNEKNVSTEKSNYQEKNIILTGLLENNTGLKDTLGFLSILIPNRLDTFYQWWNTSDCIPCGWIQYRFADRNYEPLAESGFFTNREPDSLYQLTIRHKPKRWIEAGKTLRKIDERDSSLLLDALSVSLFKEPKLIKKEKININGYSFYTYFLLSSQNFVTNKPSICVIGITSLKDRYLQIIAEHSGYDSTGFYDMMYSTILSIRIKEKP